jgi:cytochrome subunit of sulfide dehydrogenase
MKRRPASLKFLVGSLLSLFSFAVMAQAPVSANAGRNLAAQCANCHGTNGKSVAEVPSLAGQPAAVFVQKMQDYRAGKLPASIMHQLSKGYTDEQVALMADFFSKQTSQPK